MKNRGDFEGKRLTNQKIALSLHRKTSPDGGIGRRAGLKHQWSNIRVGSTPTLGTESESSAEGSDFSFPPPYGMGVPTDFHKRT